MNIRTNKNLNLLFRPLILFCEWLGRHHPLLLVRIRYLVRFHKPLRLNHPVTLNEKILYLSLKTDTSLWTKCADKYQVREYVEAKGLGDNLVKLYGVWDKPCDIDMAMLPNQFVLKTTHGSADVVIIEDKNNMDWARISNVFADKLKKGYGALEGGIHYMRIKPRMIAEELLHNDPESQKYSSSLIDYKIWCFNGKAYYIWTCCNRINGKMYVMTYDRDWIAHPEYSIFDKKHPRGELIPKPRNFERMIAVAEKLAEDFPVVRVDLYNLSGKIFFGELTFTSTGGMMYYYSPEFQRHAGNLIDLNYNSKQ